MEKIFNMEMRLFIIGCFLLSTIDCQHYNILFIPANTTKAPDYEALVQTTTLVDKTQMISDFFTHAPQYNYITAPKKFGKSMNLDMIRKFAEMEVDKKTFQLNLNKNTTKNFKIFMTMPSRFLDISKDQYVINEHMAEYPIIYVSFQNISGVYFEKMISQMNERIYEAFYQYDWLFQSHKYFTLKSNWDKQLMVERIYSKNASESDIAVSLYYLSEMLHHIFRRKVILFIDDFDTPIVTAMNKLEVNLDRVIEFMNRIIDEFRPLAGKHSAPFIHLAYAFITGRSQLGMAPRSRLIGLSIKRWRFLEEHLFTKYYGFTVRECDETLDYHHIFDEGERPKVMDRYYGYVSQGNLTRVFNPYSIVSYLCQRESNYPNVDKAIQNYWAKSEYIIPNFHNILDLIKDVRKKILDALVQKRVSFQLTLNLTTEEAQQIPLIINTRTDLPDHPIDLFFSYLFENGYFTFTGEPDNFAFPNREIEMELEEDLIKYYSDRNKMDLNPVADSLDFIVQNEDISKDVLEKFSTNLNTLLQSAANPSPRRKFLLDEYDIPGLIYLAAKSRHYEYVTGEEDILKLKGTLEPCKAGPHILIGGKNRTMLIIEMKFKQNLNEAPEQIKQYRPLKIRPKPKTLKLMNLRIENLNKTQVDMVTISF